MARLVFKYGNTGGGISVSCFDFVGYSECGVWVVVGSQQDGGAQLCIKLLVVGPDGH